MKRKKAALLAISSLGNTELATELAKLYPSSGSIEALENIRSFALTDDSKEAADEAIRTIFDQYAENVVRVEDMNSKSLATGILIDNQNIIVADYLIGIIFKFFVNAKNFKNKLSSRSAYAK